MRDRQSLDGSDDVTLGLADKIRDVAEESGLPSASVLDALVAIVGELGGAPNPVFTDPPEYARDFADAERHFVAVPDPERPLQSSHGFFDVVAARASRRDYSTEPLDIDRAMSLLHWTVGKRDEAIAYDYRGAPLRYIPSAGGLACTDVYLVAANVGGLEPGVYYYDFRTGLRFICRGRMALKIAELNPGQEWIGRASAFLVFVSNIDRVEHKYGPMAFKLLMLDAGIAVGHAELVAAALELRACIIGGLSQKRMSKLLRLDGHGRTPMVTLAVGTRGTQ